MGQIAHKRGPVDKMRDRDEHEVAHARTRAAKPVAAGSPRERRLQEAIEDDEVREALKVPRRRRPVAERGT
jgi:hypothetical protein